MPVAREVGIDPVHLAIIFIANMQTAYLLPPAGMDLVVSSLAFNQPMTKMYRIALPFGLVMIASLLLITYVPWLSLGLLEFLGK
jgi:TRAP-type C4-dicarboxylate transport system permease large subunit